MVRILKIKELEERKRSILAKSEIYRQTLTLEIRNIQFSGALQKRRLNVFQTAFRSLGVIAPLAGMLIFRRRAKPANTGSGFLSKLMTGLKFASQLRLFL